MHDPKASPEKKEGKGLIRRATKTLRKSFHISSSKDKDKEGKEESGKGGKEESSKGGEASSSLKHHASTSSLASPAASSNMSKSTSNNDIDKMLRDPS